MMLKFERWRVVNAIEQKLESGEISDSSLEINLEIDLDLLTKVDCSTVMLTSHEVRMLQDYL